MASWSELLAEFQKHVQKDPNWLDSKLKAQLGEIAKLRTPNTVIFYASSFLQNPTHHGMSIIREDMNGFMNALHGASADNGLTLILHTPGGDPNAVESIVEYLHSKFNYIEVIVPYLAMSGGAMISLASDLLVLGRQSQLGPIDPQFLIGNKSHSARAIKEGFAQAKKDIEGNTKLAHLWAPILQNMGPSLMVESTKALSYSEELVSKWLRKRKLVTENDEKSKIVNRISAYFNAEAEDRDVGTDSIHVHGQRIGIQKLKELGIKVEVLEDNHNLQNVILTAYHLMTFIFELSSSVKFIASNHGKMWAKSEPIQTVGLNPPILNSPPQRSPHPAAGSKKKKQ